MADLPADVRDRIDRHPWHLTIPRLRRYARARAARLVWGGMRRGPLPGGVQPEDVVHTAIEKLLTGVRAWDPARDPDLDRVLESVVDSEISHLVGSWEHRHVRPSAALPVPADRPEADPLEHVSSPALGPAEQVERREEDRGHVDFYSAFHATLADDPILQRIVACINEDVVKPGEIAGRLGIPVSEIYHRRKQLQRRLVAFYQDWNTTRPADDWRPGRI